MIVVHHLEHSRSQRILWLLEELEISYEVKRYARNPKTMLAPPELKAVHPLGKSPVITDGNITVAETGAIIEYLLETYGKGRLQPAAGSAEAREYRYWLHYGEGSLMPLLVMKLVIGAVPAKSPALVRPVARGIVKALDQQFIGPNLRNHVAFLTGALEGRDWLVGNTLSGADILMSFPLEALCARGGDALPASIKTYVSRVQSLPAYRRALERGGPYRLLGS